MAVLFLSIPRHHGWRQGKIRTSWLRKGVAAGRAGSYVRWGESEDSARVLRVAHIGGVQKKHEHGGIGFGMALRLFYILSEIRYLVFF